MGDCDRMKKHVSDYLDHSLDPATKKEFEQVLGKDEQLKSITDSVGRVKNLLGNLPVVHCSEEFSVRLREKILHTQKTPARDPVRRYAIPFSFAVIFILAVVLVNPFSSEESGDLPRTPAPSITPPQVSRPASIQSVDHINNGNGSNTARDIKTLDEAKAYSDSTKDKTVPELKHVDKKEIQQTRP